MERQLVLKHTDKDLFEIEDFCESFFSETNEYEAQYGILMTLSLQSFEALSPKIGERLVLKIHQNLDYICLEWQLEAQNFQNLRDWIGLQESSLLHCLWSSFVLNEEEGIVSFHLLNQGVQQAVYAKRRKQLKKYFTGNVFTPSL